MTADVINNKMEITVTDTGMGIKEEELEQIFTTFYQSERTINRGTDGLGLGLAITKQLVLKSGGEIFVKSKVGQGSQFSFTLPLASTGRNCQLKH
ncbi:ATP-binding protein [Niallia circulans]